MRIKELALTATLLTGAFGATPTWAELIVNGGFEAPPVLSVGPPPGLGFDYRTGTQITGWTITGAQEPHFNTSYNPVGGGSQALQLESISPVFQTFATTAGQLYQLSFDYSSWTHNNVTLDDAPLEVNVTGLPTLNLLGTDAGYVTHTLVFTAAAANTTLSFRNSGNFGLDFPQIDDVSVVAVTPAAVPEPASLALLGIGLAAFGLSRRRKA